MVWQLDGQTPHTHALRIRTRHYVRASTFCDTQIRYQKLDTRIDTGKCCTFAVFFHLEQEQSEETYFYYQLSAAVTQMLLSFR